jgi:hypothetical protein
MQKSPAWKLTLLFDLAKFTAAVQACQNSDDTSEIKVPARALIKLIQEVVFTHEIPTNVCDPQENSSEADSSSTLLKKVC